MGAAGFGSSVIIALAAVLWLAYLVPTWLRRREYLATERNALRLQQTLRIMAETAEVPQEVRVETTARNAAQLERVLKNQLRRTAAIAEAQAAAVARAAARRLAETQPALAADVAITSPASRRLRRSRAVTAAILFAALAGSGLGIAQFVASGAWTLLAGGSAVTLGCFAMLGQMASVGRARAELARSLRSRPAAVVAACARLRNLRPAGAHMTDYWLSKLFFDLNQSPALAAEYRENSDKVLDRYPVKPEVRAALIADDVAAISPLVNAYLLRFYFQIRGLPEAEFIGRLHAMQKKEAALG